MTKIAIIAGYGSLPLEIANNCKKDEIFISKISGITVADFSEFNYHEYGLGEFGKRFKALKELNIKTITFAGYVKRPDFSKIGMDAKGLTLLPSIISASKNGDDAIMRVIIEAFEKEGFEVIGPEQLQQNLIPKIGVLGKIMPDRNDMEDISKAINVSKQIGALDIGQGCVVSNGLVLAVEAQEGTDEMLKRISLLPIEIRPQNKSGVLCKCAKPIQDKRIDLPTIGLDTLRNVINANLKGIAIEAGASIILDKENLLKQADENGIFIFGFANEPN